MAKRFEAEEMRAEGKSSYKLENRDGKQILNLVEESNKEEGEEEIQQPLILGLTHDQNWWRHLNL
jgi:hypothetical protein